MAEDLMTYLSGRKAHGFEPRPFYSPDGDFLTFYFRGDEHYAERVDELLTIYLSMDGDELIGCKIKGVRRILDTLGKFGVEVSGQDMQLSFLFLPGASMLEDERRKRYEEIGAHTRDIRLNPSELQPVG
jgi:hypothetical protein